MESGGFNTRVLADDTELTFRLYTSGWKVVYANGAECYEEVPETWAVRGRQVRRWSSGHNNVMFRYLFRTLLTKHMSLREKLDGSLLLSLGQRGNMGNRFLPCFQEFIIISHIPENM